MEENSIPQDRLEYYRRAIIQMNAALDLSSKELESGRGDGTGWLEVADCFGAIVYRHQ